MKTSVALLLFVAGRLCTPLVAATPHALTMPQPRSRLAHTPSGGPSSGHAPVSTPAEAPVAPMEATADAPGAKAPMAMDFATADTYILAMQQTNAACPAARLCPGTTSMQHICESKFSNFQCTTFWSSGLVGKYKSVVKSEPTVETALRSAVDKVCKGCSSTMRILTVQDTPLSSVQI